MVLCIYVCHYIHMMNIYICTGEYNTMVSNTQGGDVGKLSSIANTPLSKKHVILLDIRIRSVEPRAVNWKCCSVHMPAVIEVCKVLGGLDGCIIIMWNVLYGGGVATPGSMGLGARATPSQIGVLRRIALIALIALITTGKNSSDVYSTRTRTYTYGAMLIRALRNEILYRTVGIQNLRTRLLKPPSPPQ